ncbi:MAG: NADH-quinone oxidoreductase subunit NuoE [Candidatus Heimdallarchaeota archaeon]|nr:NADH-quinone oxidoreductase subunit NuoE [Candidatus Heimdallarchaeota archaeon]MCK5048689.1 NADH-quinone oxidoreductase subunit NuoE [Candidatus Heimdallarchaeota archaeon]
MSETLTTEEVLKDFNEEKSNLIPMLQILQTKIGYVTREGVYAIAAKLNVPPAEVYGVATFFAQFKFEPSGKYHILICMGTACHVNGAREVLGAVERELGINEGETTEDGLFTIEEVACLGCCSLAPVMMINKEIHAGLTPTKAIKVIKAIRKEEENES